jgi:hypothetical protein
MLLGERSRLMLRLTRAVWRERPDVFCSPSVYTCFPLPPAVATLVAVHDTIAERFPRLTFPSSRARLFWRVKVRFAVSQAQLRRAGDEAAVAEAMDLLLREPLLRRTGRGQPVLPGASE